MTTTTAPDSLTLVYLHGAPCVRDAEGGVWHPTEESAATIRAADDQLAEAIRLMESSADAGRWID